MRDRFRARRPAFAAALTLFCLLVQSCGPGHLSSGFISTRLGQAYIPLFLRRQVIFGRWGAAVALTPTIAVTNDHNLNLIPEDRVIARSPEYDLLFFRIEDGLSPDIGVAWRGEQVIAYGQGGRRELRESRGAISSLNDLVVARCGDCRAQRALTFLADAGEGFSGGPVVDATTGAVVGITFGYQDPPDGKGPRKIFAYDIALVMDEMRRLTRTGT